MAADRILNINVTTTSNWQNSNTLFANVVWSQAGQTGLGNSNRVDASGNINLLRMPANGAFTDNVRIQLTLNDQMTLFNSNTKVKARWANTWEGSSPPLKVEGLCQFKLTCSDVDAINPLNVSAERVNDNLMRILDNRRIGQPENVPYAYVPGMIVELPTGNYFIQLDPSTGTKGGPISPIEEESC